jgi:hypothetical protein
VGNGNPLSLDPFQADNRTLFYGKAMLILRAGDGPSHGQTATEPFPSNPGAPAGRGSTGGVLPGRQCRAPGLSPGDLAGFALPRVRRKHGGQPRPVGRRQSGNCLGQSRQRVGLVGSR